MQNDGPQAAPLAVTVEDAARMLGIGRTKTYELIAERRIDARKYGSRTLVLVDSLRAFLNSLPIAA